MHRGNLHTRSSGISSMVTSSSRTSSHFIFSISSFSFFDAIVTRLRGDSGGDYSPPLALYLDSQRNLFERFKSRKEFCSTIRQTSKGTNQSYSLRGIETVSFKLSILSVTLNMW
ncbi:hypothetical protein ALC53_06770 [Atta colombica]|uniref:Uncharacterized protein n=1 Tax=Atta colombica TaxID=520822 RepID=A0A151I318_9HYME|nr:hypothetical protein ALC53_06770 [Atta colombica]